MSKLYDVLTEAIKDFEENGFDSENRLNEWLERIRQVIALGSMHQAKLDAMFRAQMRGLFDRLVTKAGILKQHPGVSRFTLNSLSSRLHADLERRILASAQLIRLNRNEAINKTLQRFSGWATSVPKGGTDQINRGKLKAQIAKPIGQLPFIERRVLIDQGHKLNSSISAVLATDNGAIAARWFSHWKQAGYDYREDHKERDNHIYLIRNSWAAREGLVKINENGWSDSITQPAEEPFCRCKWVYLYHLKQLPDEFLTAKGKQSLKKVRQ